MTELEIMQRAKTYLEKLANGIDPFTDKLVEEDDIINDVRISRCLFYTADVLRRVIEKGGIAERFEEENDKKPVKEAKKPFALTDAERIRFVFSDEAVSLSTLTRRINDLIDENTMKKLRSGSVATWLVRAGCLHEQLSVTGHPVKRPTDAGVALGIRAEMQIREDKSFIMVVYPRTAQEFIIDHLDAIIELDREYDAQDIEMKGKAHNAGQAWSQEQDELLIRLYKSDCSVNDIAGHLGRTQNGVRARLKKLALIEKRSDAK